MKKLLFILLAVSFSLYASAEEPVSSWVKTNDGKTLCQKVVVHHNKAKVTLENGEKTTIPVNTITSYSTKGNLYIKKAIYKNVRDLTPVFMKLEKSKNDFEYLTYKDEHGKREFVFKGDQLIQELNAINREEFYKFFDI